MKIIARNKTIYSLIRHTFSLLFLLTTAIFTSYSQSLLKAGPDVNASLFSEELIISSDRDLYVSGEKIWLKIYKLNSLTQTPDSSSKVVYADLLDLDNNPVIQLKTKMDGISGSCDFILPDTLRSGNYLLRAYTSWMQNFSSDLFASRTISVINPFENITNIKIPVSAQVPDSVLFFAEGGHLLAGFESMLGFRAVNHKGEPVNMSGAVTDGKNDTICVVHTGRNGYGMTSLSPSFAEPLYLISGTGIRMKKFTLPPILKEGVSFTSPAAGKNNDELARLSFSGSYPDDKGKLYLIIKSSGLADIKKEINAEKNLIITILGKDLPSGLSEIILADADGNTLSERWLSNEKSNSINFRVNQDKTKHGSREKVRIGISATDMNGKPVRSNFSVSVAKKVSVSRSSQLTGMCRQIPGMLPVAEDCDLSDINDYLIFYKPHDPAMEADTAGENRTPLYLPELEGHLVGGNLRDKVTGDPVKQCDITLSFVGRAALCLFTKTDDDGNFNFVTNEKGLREIVIQPLTLTKETYVDLKNPFATRFSNYDHGLFYPDTARLDEINNLIISTQINSIYEPFYHKQASQSKEPAGNNFYGQPENSIEMSKFIELTSVKEIVAELIPGVSTIRSGGKVSFRMTKPNQTKPYENPPLVLVDGVPVYDVDKVIGINSNEIDKVDVLIDRYFIAGNVLDGIIHFITKKGNLSAIDMNKSVFRMEYDLLHRNDNFYYPDYSQDSVMHNHLPDFRNTLYWNPDVRTDASGSALVEFYSSDEAGDFIITVEGITDDGLRGKASVALIISR